MQTQVLGLSVDSVPSLKAWAESIGGISYPLLSDFYPHGHVAKMFGVFRPKDGFAERAIFIIDRRGIIRYLKIHDIDEQPDNEVLFSELQKLEPNATPVQTSVIEHKPVENTGQPVIDSDIVMYCTPWCPACRRARAFFSENGIQYTEIDITRDREAAQQVRRWANGYETTPTFNIRGTILVNYDRAKLEKELGIG